MSKSIRNPTSSSKAEFNTRASMIGTSPLLPAPPAAPAEDETVPIPIDGQAPLLLPASADNILSKALEHQDAIWQSALETTAAEAAETVEKRLRTHGMVRQCARREVTEEHEAAAVKSLRIGVENAAQAIRDRHTTLRPDGMQKRFHFPNSRDAFEGEWKNSTLHGHGTWSHGDVLRYEGEWFLGVRQGNGHFECAPTATSYRGRWYEGRRHGRGELVEAEGVYRGEFRNGHCHGAGDYEYQDGHRYKGEWSSDRYHGQGTYTFPSGAKYEGAWRAGLQEGRGTMTWVGVAETYVGEWHRGRRHGRGTLKGAKFAYAGTWAYDVRHGQGTTQWADGTRFEGAYKDDLECGRGKMTQQDGTVYEGEWDHGCRHGEGVYTSKKQRLTYEGEWRRDKKHGSGAVSFDLAGTLSGTWIDDRLHGPAVYLPPHGAKEHMNFRAGMCVSRHPEEFVTMVQMRLGRSDGTDDVDGATGGFGIGGGSSSTTAGTEGGAS